MPQPWGLSGAQFLVVYSVAFVAALLLVIVPRYSFGLGAKGKLTPYQAAFLLGGTGRVLLTGCGELLENRRVHRSRERGLTTERGFAAGEPLQRTIVKVMSVSATWQEREDKLRRAPVIDQLKAELRASGLMMTWVGLRWWLVALFLPAAIWIVGLVRVINEAVLRMPIGYLITLLVISVITLVVLHNRVLHRGLYTTPKGATLVARLRRSHAEEARAGNDPGTVEFQLTGIAVIGLAAAAADVRSLVGTAAKFNAGLGTSGSSWLTNSAGDGNGG